MRELLLQSLMCGLLIGFGVPPLLEVEIHADPFKPSPAQVANDQGEELRKKGDFDGAIKAYTESIQLDPNFPWPFNNRGLARAAKGQYQEALQDYAEAIRLDPNYAFPHNNRGLTYAAMNDLDNAIKDYTKAIQIDLVYTFPWYNRGVAWSRKGDFEKAIADFAEAIELDPKFAAPHNEIAWIRATCRDPQFRGGKEAILFATKACELTEWNSYAELDTLAAAYAEAGEFTTAVIWGVTALEKAPEKEREKASQRLDLYRANKPYHQPVEEKPKQP